jgi:hypothetical protein
MKITLDLPEHRIEPYFTGDPDIYDGACAGCGEERYGLVVRLHPLGWLHAEKEEGTDGQTCQEKAVEKLLADPVTAWTGVARHVAKYPHRHDAATIRAVLRALADALSHPNGDTHA